MTIKDDALYKLYIMLSLNDVDAKKKRAFSTIIHALTDLNIQVSGRGRTDAHRTPVGTGGPMPDLQGGSRSQLHRYDGGCGSGRQLIAENMYNLDYWRS
jgi:hypothetical protein